jgi:hypothetical protein
MKFCSRAAHLIAKFHKFSKPATMDEHKKVARQVETQLNAQLALFAKACQGTSRLRDPSKDFAAAASVADQSASELEPQIQTLLNQYNAAIDAMSRALPASNPAGSPSSTGADHTIQRCRQIAAEYLQDFRKSKVCPFSTSSSVFPRSNLSLNQ